MTSSTIPAARAPRGSVRDGRERILAAAYELFAAHGPDAVGVDAVVERAGTAKMTLYRHFPTKDALVVAVLDRREALWTDALFSEAARRGAGPRDHLVALFEVLDEWVNATSFDGCTFIATLVASWPDRLDILAAAGAHLDRIHERIVEMARAAGLDGPEEIGWHWSLLMRGAIVSAQAGHRDAARIAGRIAAASLPEAPSGSR
ncbi:MAG: helix-turn-helix domain-containing protein [Chloroflexota bacterium]